VCVFGGVGIHQGLRLREDGRGQTGVPILTDVHTENEVVQVASVVDVVQTPVFLAHQADFIRAVAQCGKPVNIKKGPFMAPGEMQQVIQRAREAAREASLPEDVFLACERGTSFGYNDLIADMRSLAVMRETACPVVFDVSHSAQLPGLQ
ncbi:3-deoxy-8-phosphooctulonate synthase, partial [Pseudomonas sp. MWU12-2115]